MGTNQTFVRAFFSDSGSLSSYWNLLAVLVVILIIREQFQFMASPRRYFGQLENWIEMTIIVLVSVLLFGENFLCRVHAIRSVSAWIIFLSWFELLIMFNRLPGLGSSKTVMNMLYKVCTFQTCKRLVINYRKTN